MDVATIMNAVKAQVDILEPAADVHARYLPIMDAKDIEPNDVFISIVPRAIESAKTTKAIDTEIYIVDIAMQARVEWEDNNPDHAKLANLTNRLNNIRRYFSRRELSFTGGKAVVVDSVVDPIYYQEHLEDPQLYTGVVRLRIDYTNDLIFVVPLPNP